MPKNHSNKSFSIANFEISLDESENIVVIKELKGAKYSLIAVDDLNKEKKLFSFELIHEMQIDFHTLKQINDIVLGCEHKTKTE